MAKEGKCWIFLDHLPHQTSKVGSQKNRLGQLYGISFHGIETKSLNQVRLVVVLHFHLNHLLSQDASWLTRQSSICTFTGVPKPFWLVHTFRILKVSCLHRNGYCKLQNGYNRRQKVLFDYKRTVMVNESSHETASTYSILLGVFFSLGQLPRKTLGLQPAYHSAFLRISIKLVLKAMLRNRNKGKTGERCFVLLYVHF